MDSLNQSMQEYRECIGIQEAPVFVDNNYRSLPWMTENTVRGVLAFGYFEDRKQGLQYQSNGIGGLIDKGYFSTLILLDGNATGLFDGGSLSGYRSMGEECGGYRIWKKISVK